MYGSVIARDVLALEQRTSSRARETPGRQSSLLLRQIRRRREVVVRVVLGQVGLGLEPGIFLQEILALLPVLLRGPEQRLVLGVLGVDDEHGAVDLPER